MPRTKIRRITATLFLPAIIATVTSAPSRAAQVTSHALQDFDQYVQARESSDQHNDAANKNFLWMDTQPPPDRERIYTALKQGKIIVRPTQACSPPACPDPPGALIHDWTAIAFIPGVTLAQTLATLQDYQRDAEYYSPQVTRSRLLSRSGDNFRVFLRLQQKRVITVVLDTEYEIHYVTIDAAHAAATSRSTRVAEIENADTPQEHILSTAEDHGFLWRLNSYWRFYQADGGVYIQCRAISLTRDVPPALGWMIGRFIENISRESLIFTLTATRNAVQKNFRGAPRNANVEHQRKQ
ncbi:MAG: hypothetical protein ABLQ96_09810 [Candidatus Acidiferrum sp.]